MRTVINRGSSPRLILYLIVVLLILAVSGSITIRGGGGGGSLWRWQVDRAVSVCVMIHYAIVLKSRSSLRQCLCPSRATASNINSTHFWRTLAINIFVFWLFHLLNNYHFDIKYFIYYRIFIFYRIITLLQSQCCAPVIFFHYNIHLVNIKEKRNWSKTVYLFSTLSVLNFFIILAERRIMYYESNIL